MGPRNIEEAIAIAIRWAKDNVSADVNGGLNPMMEGTYDDLGLVWPLGWISACPRQHSRLWSAVRREVWAWMEGGMRGEG
jgi:hypothetical protein